MPPDSVDLGYVRIELDAVQAFVETIRCKQLATASCSTT